MVAVQAARSERYDRYHIKVMQSVNGWRARAFVGRLRVDEDVVEGSMEAALASCREMLAHRLARQRAARLRGVPDAEEYAEGLNLIWDELSGGQRAMLLAHARELNLTAGELAAAGGYAGYQTANLKYGEIGRMLAERLSITLERRFGDQSFIYTSALAGEGPRDTAGNWCWTIHASLRQALLTSFAA